MEVTAEELQYVLNTVLQNSKYHPPWGPALPWRGGGDHAGCLQLLQALCSLELQTHFPGLACG